MDDAHFMALAMAEAEAAGRIDEVPVGAVLVDATGQVLARDGNRQISTNDPTGHAEIRVLRAAALKAKNYRLLDTTLYVTLEPCTMCCGAIVHARIRRVVFATREPKAGAVVSTADLLTRSALNHRVVWSEGVCASASSALLKAFFASRRASKIGEDPGQ